MEQCKIDFTSIPWEIPAGEKDKHIGRALTKVVKMIFVEDVP
ncbi:MAG: hypothetical protein OIN66_00370 [Candidatus Methanoperedens sp.]|nr:hypothetical protein [Candidatus Methanoperedens sp.]